jgi:hypothetical protein
MTDLIGHNQSASSDSSMNIGSLISMFNPGLSSPMESNSLASMFGSTDILSAGKSMLSMATPFLKPFSSKAQDIANKGILAIKEPAVAPRLRRFASLVKPIFEVFMTSFAKKTHSETKQLRKLIYYTLAQGVHSEALDKLNCDSYIKATLLQRAAHIVDLEMVYAKFLQEVTKNMLEGIYQEAGNIFAGTFKNLLNNPMEMLSNLSGIYQLCDYLPYNKFRVLFIHPDSLWESDAYVKHREDTQFERIKNQLVRLVGDNSHAFLDKYAHYLLGLRQEMNKICDLLAANDRHLIKYCKEKTIDETQLFNINKTCILELLNAGLRNISSQDYDKQRTLEKVVKEKMESVNEHNTWVQFENRTMQSIHQFRSNMQDVTRTFYSDPAHMMNLTLEVFGSLNVREWLLFLSDITKVKTINEIHRAVIKHVGDIPVFVEDIVKFIENDFLSGSKTRFLQFMLKLEIAQKGGEGALKVFLLKHWMTTPYLHTLYTPKIMAQIEVLDEDKKSQALERLNFLAKHGSIETARPLLKEVDDLYEPFKIALENDEGEFCLLMLKAAKKKDKDVFTMKPVEIKEQEKILRAVLVYIEKDESKGLPILQGLMAYEGWNKKMLEKLMRETENNTIKNILLPQQKSSKSKKSESVSSSSSTSLSTALISLPSGSSVSSLIFKPVTLSGMNPIVKIQIFAEEKCERDVVNVQCYGLVMSMIQFFQAYVVTAKNNLIPGVSIEQARRMRNALVHQQVYNEKTRTVLNRTLMEPPNRSIMEPLQTHKNRSNGLTSLANF